MPRAWYSVALSNPEGLTDFGSHPSLPGVLRMNATPQADWRSHEGSIPWAEVAYAWISALVMFEITGLLVLNRGRLSSQHLSVT